MRTRLSDGVYIYVYNIMSVTLMRMRIVIRVPGGSGRSCAWGWNPNLKRIQYGEPSALGGMESWTGRRSRRATLLGVHARVESA